MAVERERVADSLAQPRRSETSELSGAAGAILALQQSAGNASVSSLLLRRAALQRQPLPAAAPDEPTLPDWTDAQLRSIQRQLRRIGLYGAGIDAIAGPRTRGGLTEAFGNAHWRTMAATEIIDQLSRAPALPREQRGRRVRYAELFRDGLLDMTLGIGFDEGGGHMRKLPEFVQALEERGFTESREQAAALYQQAGRSLPDDAFGRFFVRQNVLAYRPPAGSERPVHAVVRLLISETGAEGGQAAAAFREGMVQSDVTYYSGHGRYGSGPDFDRNLSFVLTHDDGTREPIEDYNVLEERLTALGRQESPRRSAWAEFERRVEAGTLEARGVHSGNVYLNPTRRHGEFGARLMYWSLQQSGAAGGTLATGPGGPLATATAADPDRYRLLVFTGCRTLDYTEQLRATPGLDPESTDIVASRRVVYSTDASRTLAAFLDNIIRQQSAQQVVRDMDAQQADGPGVYSLEGLRDNPG